MGEKIVKILGAGVSGLTCAINLARAGFEVEVFEKQEAIGAHYPENPQMLPNWFSKKDVIEELEECGIKIIWKNKIKEVEINFNGLKAVIYGKDKPLGYTVLRGGKRSLEKDLEKQALEAGAKIITSFEGDINSDIIATGVGQTITVGYGQVFKGDFVPTQVKVVFNSKWCPTIGYCYFFPHNKSLATVKTSKTLQDKDVDLKANLEKFKQGYLQNEIKQADFLYDFGTMRSFNIPKTAKTEKGALILGEAAGFQDELFRFGMRYAIISGYLAAEAIIKGLDYDKLWKGRFMPEFNRTAKIRRAFLELKKTGLKTFQNSQTFHISFNKVKKIWLSFWLKPALSLFPVYKKIVFMPKVSNFLMRGLKIIGLFGAKSD